MILWIWFGAVFAALFFYFRQAYSRFSNHGIKFATPMPFVGNLGRMLMRKENLADNINRLYYAYPGEKFVGRFEFLRPMVLLRDLELIKKVTIKDFDNFTDRRIEVQKQADPSFGSNLFFLKGQEWKDMRSTLSPAFTSSKIRLMVPFMVEVGDQMIAAVRKKMQGAKNDYVDIDVKDLMSRSTNDVIASCAFGFKVDSHTEPENEFFVKGKESTNFNFKQLLMFFGFVSFPWLMNIVMTMLAEKNPKNYFKSLVLNTMEEREKHNIVRPDMIHLLMEAKKGKLTHTDKGVDADAGFATVEESAEGKREVNRAWNDDELVAQARLFFVAGYETVSTVLSFLLHELAVNPDIQDKLYEEVREYDADNGGKFDYTSIQKMTYLDMVVTELLRLWPPVVTLDRRSKSDYNLGRPNNSAKEDYILRKGESVGIPVWTIHRNPEYFPNPLKFDPERFSEENKHNIKHSSYMPFGQGPRNCIGSRFALCEVKVMVYLLVKNMEMSPAAKTQLPAKLQTNSFNMRLQGGHWVRFKLRD